MPTEYNSRVLKLRLPEQDELKNEPEHCSADLGMLGSIGRSIGQQVRIKRKDDPHFIALYTVKQGNPDLDSSDPESANIVRTGQGGRERLGTTAETEGTVEAKVVDAVPKPGDPDRVRFFEVAKDDREQAYFVAIAPHGGEIERHTDEQAEETAQELIAAGFPASLWLCKGDGDQVKGASDRWHITSDDINPACFPLLQQLMSRRFCCGLAFHGFQHQEGEADVYIGGSAPWSLKTAIERALNNLDRPIKVKISTTDDDPKFQGFNPKNIINRLATYGIHLEQSFEARERCHGEIACVIGKVFASRHRRLLCTFLKDLEEQRAKEEAQLAKSLSKDLAAGSIDVEEAMVKHKAWRAKDEALAVKIKASEELLTFIEERIDELKT